MEWYRRNNYPSPAYGVGYGFNDMGVAARSTLGRRGIGRDHWDGRGDRDSSWRLGLSYHSGRGWDRYDGWPYRLGGYDHHHHHGFRRWCYPTTTVVAGWNYPWYGWGAWAGSGWGYSYVWDYPTYSYGLWDSPDTDIEYEDVNIINNYYGNDYADTGSATGINAVPLAPATTPSAPAAPAVEPHDQLGLQAFNQGDYELARREFVRAILATPDAPELTMLYGYAHFATGDYMIAAMAIRRATEADATLIESPIDVAALYGDRSDFQAQLAKLDAHVAANPADLDAKYLAGFVRYASGDPNGAGAIFAECMAANPDDSAYFIMRDAALRASVAQQAAERAAADEAARSAAPSSDPE